MRAHDPFAPIVIWQSADARPDANDGAPVFRHDWPELLEQCRAAVARREAAYPQLVREGRMDADDASRDLDAWHLLAAEWHWIITGEGEAPHLATLLARIDAVALAISRVETELQRRATDCLIYQRHLLLAIAWHLGDGRAGPAIHHIARLNHARRAGGAVQAQRKAA